MPVGSHLDIWDCLASSREIPPPKNNSQKAEEFWDFGVCAVSESLPFKGKQLDEEGRGFLLLKSTSVEKPGVLGL